MADLGTDRGAMRPAAEDASLGDLVARLTSDFGELVSTQVELAKVEIKDEVTRAGKSAGFLTGAALAGCLAVALLSWAAAWGLAETMATGWAFLLVGVIWVVVAAVLASSGRRQLKEIRSLPQATQSLKEDVEWARQQKS